MRTLSRTDPRALLGEAALVETFEVSYPSPVHGNRIWLRKSPMKTEFQEPVEFNYSTTPVYSASTYTDSWGNPVILFSRSVPHETMKIELRSRVKLFRETYAPSDADEMSISAWQNKKRAPDLEQFENESGKVILDGVTRRIAQSILKNSSGKWGNTVRAMRQWVHTQIRYRSGVTESHTDSSGPLRMREGVCQDLTHVFLSLVRSAGIPARYVGGYQLNGTEMHSWAEVYFSDGTWRTYDPTEDKDDLPKIIVSRGRDYLDSRPVQGSFRSAGGTSEMKSVISVKWMETKK